MAIYAIGDIHGCYDTLQRLLAVLKFDPDVDTLWCTGDLINRGPQPLAVLRFLSSLPEASCVSVLGNHDIHLLSVAAGVVPYQNQDQFDEVLTAPDRCALLAWLRQRPLLYLSPDQRHALVHAGIAPQWDLATTIACANEVTAILAGPNSATFLAQLYGQQPTHWHAELSTIERCRFTVNALTRMRYYNTTDGINDSLKVAPSHPDAADWQPWFTACHLLPDTLHVIFGHWSSLKACTYKSQFHALDSGCVHGGYLTAFDVLNHTRYQVSRW